jgi:phage-related protein
MNEGNRRVLPAVFYRTEAGNEPVLEWLMKMTRGDRRIVGTDIRTVELGWPIGMPVCRPMGDGLFEVRSHIRDGIARVLFCTYDGEMVLLHGFVKKSEKTPAGDLQLAIKRKRETER